MSDDKEIIIREIGLFLLKEPHLSDEMDRRQDDESIADPDIPIVEGVKIVVNGLHADIEKLQEKLHRIAKIVKEK